MEQLRHIDACLVLASIPLLPVIQNKTEVASMSAVVEEVLSRNGLTHNISGLFGEKTGSTTGDSPSL